MTYIRSFLRLSASGNSLSSLVFSGAVMFSLSRTTDFPQQQPGFLFRAPLQWEPQPVPHASALCCRPQSACPKAQVPVRPGANHAVFLMYRLSVLRSQNHFHTLSLHKNAPHQSGEGRL